jgi:cell division protein FtsB
MPGATRSPALEMLRAAARLVLGPPRRLAHWLRGHWLVLATALILVYFGYHAVHGQRGLLAWLETSREHDLAARQLRRLEEERAALQARVDRLRPDRLDPDVLEEELRKLGYIEPGEVIVLRHR